jgi:prevent-host-death family protein
LSERPSETGKNRSLGVVRQSNSEDFMTVTVNIGEAKARFSELIAKAEAGEEIIIARGNEPVARLAPLAEQAERAALMERALALRDSGAIKPVSVEEILAWRHEGHKY